MNLIPENYDAWNLIAKFGDAFFEGADRDGVNIEGIRYAIETSDIPPERHHLTFQKVLKFCVTAINSAKQDNREYLVRL